MSGEKPFNAMDFVADAFGLTKPKESDKPENKEFMNDVADEQARLGNNFETMPYEEVDESKFEEEE